MKKIFPLLLILAIIGSYNPAQAQDIQKGNPGMWPAFIKYTSTSPGFNTAGILMTDEAGRSATLTNGILKHVETDKVGLKHYRYQQYFNGIAIENAAWVVHVMNGNIKSQNGKWVKDLPVSLTNTPSLSQTTALNAALQTVGAQQYKWQLPAEEAFLQREQKDRHATFYPKGTLVYYSGEKDVIPSALRLAWKFDIYAQSPLSRQIIFVDAANGKILGRRELIHATDVPGTAQTVYSGTQNIMTENTGASYRLSETGRGNGISTYNLQGGTFYWNAVDFTDADNNWNNVNPAKDEYAADAHWGAEKTYDYYFQSFNRNSVNGSGLALNSYVHYSTGVFNASWDGDRMFYGDGDAGHGNKPLTSLDVCGHEITHGVTQYTSGLVYSYESGAMNEGFSDIFGTAIEAFARPTNYDWLIGSDFYTIRNMSNPNAFNQPDTYEGTFWYNGTLDEGGVHTNSGVLNYWFYLLTMGGSGVNDHGTAYNVTGIGMQKASAIAYLLNTSYLVSTSDYYAARTLGILAAESLYGGGSPEAIQTANAWTAVGLYAASCSPVSGLSASPILDMSATLHWTSISGATSYKVQFKASTSSTWSTPTTVTADSMNIGGLSASAVYDWRVRPNCNGQYTYGQFTTTSPICNAPAGINFTAGSTSTTLTWNAAFYAMGYTVEYKLATDTVWTVAGNTNTATYTLTGLTNPVTYDCRIRTNCNFGSSGYTQFQFTTTTTPCIAPTGVAFSYSNNTSTFTWNAVPGAVQYTVELDWAGGGWHLFDDLATANSYSITNLMQGGNYQLRVKANCGSGNSLYSATLFFTTPCSAPGGLTTTNITTTGATLNWVPAAGSNANSAFAVAYRLGNTNNAWISLGNTTASSKNVTGLTAGTLYEWRVQKLCSGSNSVTVTAQFSTVALPCNAPTGPASSNISASQATVSWTAVTGAVTYSVQYKPASSSTWSSSISTNATNLVIAGLNPSTLYDWRVMTNCSSNTSSFVAAQFTTLVPPCNAPTGLSSSGITASQAIISWSAVSGAVSYSVQYKAASSSTWSAAVSTSATNRVITGLSASTLYDWRVMTNCNANASAYSAAQFTTSTGSCGVPTGLYATGIGNSNAVINWSAVAGANSYTLQYKTVASTTWSQVSNINGTNTALTNLSMGTVYEYKLSSKCGSVNSAYSPVSSFTTLNCVSSADNTAEWIDLFKIGSINRVSGADAGGYINTGLATNLVIGSTANAGQISAGFSGAVNSQNFCIYIDLNRNGSFNETGERMYGSAFIGSNGIISFSMNIPATATAGVTGMRVVMRRTSNGIVSPCLTGFLGETEDYTVNLIASASRGTASEETIINDVKPEKSIAVSPNPSEGLFNIALSKNTEPVYYEVVNISGSVVQKQNIAGKRSFNIDITRMPDGLYLLRVIDQSGQKLISKLLKK